MNSRATALGWAALSSFVLSLVAVGVGCSSPAPGSLRDDASTDDDNEQTAAKKPTTPSTPAKSTTPTTPTTPAPAPTQTPTPKPDAGTPTPTTDACGQLLTCCNGLQDTISKLACTAAAAAANGKQDTCSKELLGCQLAGGLGGLGGGGGNDECIDDFDCPGNLICIRGLCQ